MKHWLLFGGLIIIAVVLLMRSRVSVTSTLPTPTTASTTPATLPATTLPSTRPAGVRLGNAPASALPIPTH